MTVRSVASCTAHLRAAAPQVCTARGVDECSGANGGCGSVTYIGCAVKKWMSYRVERGNLTKIRVPMNSTAGGGTNETQWEHHDITFEADLAKVDQLIARGALWRDVVQPACAAAEPLSRMCGRRRGVLRDG